MKSKIDYTEEINITVIIILILAIFITTHISQTQIKRLGNDLDVQRCVSEMIFQTSVSGGDEHTHTIEIDQDIFDACEELNK